MDASSFGEFSQRMLNLELVFDISFTDEELVSLPNWTLFDEKIVTGISSIRPQVHLPQAPSGIRNSINGTVWSLVKLQPETIRKTGGRRRFFFNPPPRPPTPATFSLRALVDEFGVENPLSRDNGDIVPQSLIIICKYVSIRTKCRLTGKKAPGLRALLRQLYINLDMLLCHSQITSLASTPMDASHIESSLKVLMTPSFSRML